ncbi:OmpA family protein [Mesoterricola silvestris]|uniref:Membrane protein n=1 Tax=Mesoterricola silvestris TaxID=2927979 RepID=A0AA48H8G3_9BACT|nr:OmpA family protein [Mesoterricola silvestris]BDU73713.1 membrane protein [Mesoterricola silvestris]
MKRHILLPAALLAFAPAFAKPDVPGSKDHPLLTRMQNMGIVVYATNPFQRYEFRTGKGRGATTPVEGKYYQIRYKMADGPAAPTPIAIIRNHQAALQKVGGTVLFEDNRYTTLKVAKGGLETWVEVDTAWGRGYQLTIIEKGAMAQEVVADAAAMKGDLKSTGHVALYGIYFDTNKSDVKAESRAALEEIAKLLGQDPALKLKVVGHTDMTGVLDANMRLSQARGEAVVKALVGQYGIAPARLRGHGVGPLAPVASNDTEEGRAKNRRVELVKE